MTRRTRVVRLGQFVLLLVWLGLTVRPVSGRGRLTHRGIEPPAGRANGFVFDLMAVGDPLPWAGVELSGNTDEFLYPPDGRPGFPSVLPNPDRTLKQKWHLHDPFAPLPGLLLALALPPLLADRLTGPRRWDRWLLVAAAAAAGGLACGVVRMVLFGWADRGLIGFVVTHLHDAEPVTFARHALTGLLAPDSRELVRGLAVLFGLTVGGVAAAGGLRPWRTERTAQPEPPREQPFTTPGSPL